MRTPDYERGNDAKQCKARDLRFDEITSRRFRACNLLWHSVLPEVGAINTMKICYGAVYEGEILAVAAWSNPVARALPQAEWLELRRMACGPAAPQNAASRMLGWMARDIAIRFPDVMRLISYQDHDHHAGTIYRAAGWTPLPVETGRGGAWSNRGRFNRKAERRKRKTRWEKVLRHRKMLDGAPPKIVQANLFGNEVGQMSKPCKFILAWSGPCNKQTDNESGYCGAHEGLKCRCGEQAVGECDHTYMQFICGAPICGDKCKHSHGDSR